MGKSWSFFFALKVRTNVPFPVTCPSGTWLSLSLFLRLVGILAIPQEGLLLLLSFDLELPIIHKAPLMGHRVCTQLRTNITKQSTAAEWAKPTCTTNVILTFPKMGMPNAPEDSKAPNPSLDFLLLLVTTLILGLDL